MLDLQVLIALRVVEILVASQLRSGSREHVERSL